MSQQTKKTIPQPDKFLAKELLRKNGHAIKKYWPVLLLAQLPALIFYLLLTYQKPFPQTQMVSDKKNTELHKQHSTHIKNIEQRFNELNQRFVALQNQHAKTVKSLILLKTATAQQGNIPSVNLIKKTTLDTLDRIGEKIRLNEPFSGVLSSLPKECSAFPGYKTLQQFSSRLPLSFIQLKKAFEDMRKNYTPPKVKSILPKWLEKIASTFHGNIKIEKANQSDESPLQPIADALEAQDLKLAYSFAKNIQIQSIGLWAKHVAERISLDEDYSLFAEKLQNWVKQTILGNQTPPTNTTQESIP